MHEINFTRLPPFSVCNNANIENMREPGDEANPLYGPRRERE
jgi:hypothetical protein